MDIVRQYLRIKKVKPLPQEEINKLIKHAQNKNNGHVKATNTLIQANLGLVAQQARKWKPTSVAEFDDYFQEGVIGLRRAIEKYKPNKKCCFSTYACWWIKQKISRFKEHSSRELATPQYIIQIQNRYSRLRSDDTDKTDDFWMKYISRESGKPIDSIHYAITHHRRSVCLDKPLDDSDEPIQVGEIDSCEGLERIDCKKLLSYLNERDRYILERRMDGDTFEVIADELDLSRERIRQLQDNALRKIRAILKSTREYLEVDSVGSSCQNR